MDTQCITLAKDKLFIRPLKMLTPNLKALQAAK